VFSETIYKVFVKRLGERPTHRSIAVALGNFLNYSAVGNKLILGPVGLKIFHSQNLADRPNKAFGFYRAGLRKRPFDIKDN
jgi:hypothetical protein